MTDGKLPRISVRQFSSTTGAKGCVTISLPAQYGDFPCSDGTLRSGVLLGTGGLVRAYTTATSRALEAAEVVTVRSVVALDVTVDYGLYERADLLIKAAGGKLAEPEFTDKVTLRWQMPEHTEGPLLTQLQELTRGTANVTVSEPFYAAF